MRRGLFLLIFAVSGAAALIYEVVWTRLLTLHLGHGLAAASAVLAAFMGGLAAGAGAAGRVAGRFSPSHALRVYAGLEIAIAVLALLMPFALIAVRPLLAATYADGAGGGHVRIAARWSPACCCCACRRRAWARRSRSPRAGWCAWRPPRPRTPAGCMRPTRSAPRPARCSRASSLIPALGLQRHDVRRRGVECDRGRAARGLHRADRGTACRSTAEAGHHAERRAKAVQPQAPKSQDGRQAPVAKRASCARGSRRLRLARADSRR